MAGVASRLPSSTMTISNSRKSAGRAASASRTTGSMFASSLCAGRTRDRKCSVVMACSFARRWMPAAPLRAAGTAEDDAPADGVVDQRPAQDARGARREVVGEGQRQREDGLVDDEA